MIIDNDEYENKYIYIYVCILMVLYMAYMRIVLHMYIYSDIHELEYRCILSLDRCCFTEFLDSWRWLSICLPFPVFDVHSLL